MDKWRVFCIEQDVSKYLSDKAEPFEGPPLEQLSKREN